MQTTWRKQMSLMKSYSHKSKSTRRPHPLRQMLRRQFENRFLQDFEAKNSDASAEDQRSLSGARETELERPEITADDADDMEKDESNEKLSQEHAATNPSADLTVRKQPNNLRFIALEDFEPHQPATWTRRHLRRTINTPA